MKLLYSAWVEKYLSENEKHNKKIEEKEFLAYILTQYTGSSFYNKPFLKDLFKCINSSCSHFRDGKIDVFMIKL